MDFYGWWFCVGSKVKAFFNKEPCQTCFMGNWHFGLIINDSWLSIKLSSNGQKISLRSDPNSIKIIF